MCNGLVRLLGFPDTLGHIVLKDTQNKSRSSTDAHRHSSKLWWPDAEMLSVVPGKEPSGATISCQTNTEHYFCFLPLSHKSKNPLPISFGY